MQARRDRNRELDLGRIALGSKLTFCPSDDHEERFPAQVLCRTHSGMPIPPDKSRYPGTTERLPQTGQQTRLHPLQFRVCNLHGGDSDTNSRRSIAHRSAFLAPSAPQIVLALLLQAGAAIADTAI